MNHQSGAFQGEGMCQLITQLRYKKVSLHGFNLLNARLQARWAVNHIFRILQVNCWEEGGGLWKRRGIAPDSWSTRTHRHGEAASAPFPHLPLWECHFFWILWTIWCFESQKQCSSYEACGIRIVCKRFCRVCWLPFFQTIFWLKSTAMRDWNFFLWTEQSQISYHISPQNLFPWKMSETAFMHESSNSWWN